VIESQCSESCPLSTLDSLVGGYIVVELVFDVCVWGGGRGMEVGGVGRVAVAHTCWYIRQCFDDIALHSRSIGCKKVGPALGPGTGYWMEYLRNDLSHLNLNSSSLTYSTRPFTRCERCVAMCNRFG